MRPLEIGAPTPPVPAYTPPANADSVEEPPRERAESAPPVDRSRTWMHRCYAVTTPSIGGTHLHCANLLWQIAPDIPKSFNWRDRPDVLGLHRYIDALVLRDSMVCAHYERRSLVSDVEPAPVAADEVRISVPLPQFVDFFLLRGEISMPLWGKVQFTQSETSKRFVPTEFIAAVKALAEHTRRSEGVPPIDTQSPWSVKLSDAHLVRRGASPATLVTDAYADDAAEEDVPMSPPAEVEVAREVGERVACTLTHVRPVGETPFYVLRYLDLRLARWVWVGTAWSAGGPWSVQERDNAAIIALGIHPPA